MFERLKARKRNRQIIDDLYGEIVSHARTPELFGDAGIPDTVMGRFEALAIHVYLILARCRGEPSLRPLSQELVDRFMLDLDHSIRELGVGDLSVPKRMRKLAGMFYARVGAYDAAIEAGDSQALEAALATRALPPEAGEDAARRLAAYMLSRKSEYDAVPSDALRGGRLSD
ncbi:ubiquinol-cytochrome C chaperone family protein [Consotaella aegiceratis]|uniref:ubiquinol-cytochrome C chaperone family protein n=1 Tax=Consotaella aegiceratis TaxID=3097961 RepID=UPI002F41A75D